MFKLVPQQFFPPSNRAEILVDLKLEEGASLTATEAAVKKVEQFLATTTRHRQLCSLCWHRFATFLFAFRSAITAGQFCPICGIGIVFR